MRRHLNDVKKWLKDTENQLVEQQAEVTRLTQVVVQQVGFLCP
jgi:hypothetical protein